MWKSSEERTNNSQPALVMQFRSTTCSPEHCHDNKKIPENKKMQVTLSEEFLEIWAESQYNIFITIPSFLSETVTVTIVTAILKKKIPC